MLKQFYEKVLPSQGVYCVTAIDKNKVPYNRFAESLDELITIVEGLNTKQTNIFVAPGSFHNHSRKASNSAFMRSLFIDLDVGEAKDYKTKLDAINALDHLLDVTELPPPAVVDSGGGVHAYWAFDEDIPVERWKPCAEKFKAKVLEHIKIDRVVTSDAARIMRAPFTVNYKYDPPCPTSTLTDEVEQYSFLAFEEFVGCEPVAHNVLDSVVKGLDEDTAQVVRIELAALSDEETAKLSNIETVFEVIALKSLEGDDGCNQLRHILLSPEVCSEPLWRTGLTIARACVDWEDAIHKMSMGHPGYTPEATEVKARETLDPITKKPRPNGCYVFDSINPGGCDGCPHRGKITNPLALGRRLKEAPTLPTEDAIRQEQDSETVPAFPELLKPYVRAANGGIYYLPAPVVNEEGKKIQDDPVMIIAHDLWPTKRMYSGLDGECLMMRLLLPNDGKREFMLPMKHVYVTDKLKEILAGVGVSFDPHNIKHLMSYIVKWSQYMILASSAENMRMQMGWTEDNQGFVIGHSEIRSTGETVKTAASPLVRSQAKLIRKEGSYDEWKGAANLLNAPGLEMHAFGMCVGFGSPLMRLTSTSGGTICFTGPSGNGKTGALYACQSIYGDPKGLSLSGNKKGATDNGLVGWYTGLKNVPFGLDEASNKDGEEVSELVHRVSQGSGKVRMQAMVNAIREIEQHASMIAFLTSNQSLYDKLYSYKAAPDGEAARLIEFSIMRPNVLTREMGVRIFDTMRKNYGFAIQDYIEYFYKRGEGYVKDVVGDWTIRFSKDFGQDGTYRFYENIIGSTMAGAQLARDCGIITLDLERMYNKILVEVLDIRDKTVKINDIDFKALIGEYMNRNQNGTLVINAGRIIREPRMSLVSRVEVERGMYYVSKTEFKKYLSELQVSAREFENTLSTEGTLSYRGKQRLSNGWSGMTSTPISVYGFRIDIPPEMLSE